MEQTTAKPSQSETDGPGPVVIEVITGAPFPAVVFDIREARIVAASPSAHALLAPDDGDLTGRRLESFFADGLSGALDLLMAGRLQSYATSHSLRRGSAPPLTVHVWVQAIGREMPPRFAVAVLASAAARAGLRLPAPASPGLTPVVGTADEGLMIERISSDVEALLGYRPADVTGRSILTLVDRSCVAGLADAAAQVAESRAGVFLEVVARARGGEEILLEAVLWPLLPAPRLGFALLPRPAAEHADGSRAEVEAQVTRLARAGALELLGRVTVAPRWRDPSAAGQFTTRELEIVGRLVSGDRVPAIAAALFVSQSTVRNHLLSVYGKLGVHSQQELIDAFRDKPASR
jgi:DNA-binding CsgD family transcriptional regulator